MSEIQEPIDSSAPLEEPQESAARVPENQNESDGQNDVRQAETPLETVKRLGVPEQVLPQELIEDEELFKIFAHILPEIKSRISFSSMMGTDFAEEDHGVQGKTGMSKLFFKALEIAIQAKRPDIGSRFAEVAHFDKTRTRTFVWNECIMRLIHKYGWEYLYEAGKHFDFEQEKMSASHLHSITDQLDRVKTAEALDKITADYHLYLEHVAPDSASDQKLLSAASHAVEAQLSQGMLEKAEELVQLFNLSGERVWGAQERASGSFIESGQYSRAIELAKRFDIDEEYLQLRFKDKYLVVLNQLNWIEIHKLQEEHGEYLALANEANITSALVAGIRERFDGRSASPAWFLSEANKGELAALPDTVLKHRSIAYLTMALWTDLFLKSDHEHSDQVAQTFRLTPQQLDHYLRQEVEMCFKQLDWLPDDRGYVRVTKRRTTRKEGISYWVESSAKADERDRKQFLKTKDLDEIMFLANSNASRRDIVDDPANQRKIFDSLKAMRRDRSKIGTYVGLLSEDLQRELMFADLERAIQDNQPRVFQRVADELGIMKDMASRWRELQQCLKTGFSLYEISQRPYLVSPLIPKNLKPQPA